MDDIAVDSGQWTVDSCFVKEIKPFLLWAIGSIHEVIYVLTAVAIAISNPVSSELILPEMRRRHCRVPTVNRGRDTPRALDSISF